MDDQIRSFGMSTFLICEDLAEVESRFSVELGQPRREAVDERQYYPQFESSIRAQAAQMARHYEAFYCLEVSIRSLISESLRDADGADWWTGPRVPPAIATEVTKRIQRELDTGVTRRSDEPIDYTTFGELSVLITANWDVFGSIFRSRRAVENVMASLNLLRGPIAHCSPMTEDEADRLLLAVKDWFRIMS